jgi:REP element-mobilizing transposase RayT
VIQRGNNRQAIFACAADYQMLLGLLDENAKKFAVAIHAYVLMGNHFHLLATPQTADGLPQMMQAVGRRYVRYFNDSQKRTGTLWEGRYKSTLIQTDRYLLACMVYIDLNPVRAALVVRPQDYPWSSHGHYIGQRVDKLITPHALVWALGNTPFARTSTTPAAWVLWPTSRASSRMTSSNALKILENLDHRGAVGADKLMGDGAGILIQIARRALPRRNGSKQGVTCRRPASTAWA